MAATRGSRTPEKHSAPRWAIPGSPTPAAVASNFERMVRIADSIGIELGDWMESVTEKVRSDLALDRLRDRPEDAREHESGPAPA